MLLTVVHERCELTSPLIEGSASVYWPFWDINVVWGLWVFTSGIRLVIPVSGPQTLFLCEQENFPHICLVLYFFSSRKWRKSWSIPLSSVHVSVCRLMSISSLVLRPGGTECCVSNVADVPRFSVGMDGCRWISDTHPCWCHPSNSFITLVSRKFTELQDILCVKLISETMPLRYSINALRQSLLPFQLRIISSMKRTQSII